MSREKTRILASLIVPLSLLFVIWSIKAVEVLKNLNFYTLGIRPLTWGGLLGIVTSPFIHGDWQHLMANSLPLFFLSWGLFYFYRKIAWGSLTLITIITGLWVWVFGRDSYHIGASGIIYGLASFLFVSGWLRREMKLAAVSMLIIFLYGGMVWGIFPMEDRISWESHLMGMIAGVVVAFFYKNKGPQPPKYSWEIEEQEEALKEKLDYEMFEKELEEIKYHYIQHPKNNEKPPDEPDNK